MFESISPEAELGLPELLAAEGEPPLELLLADAALLVVLLRYHHQRVDQLLDWEGCLIVGLQSTSNEYRFR